MKFYESIIIIRQDISSVDVDRIVNSLKKIVDTHGGQVIKTEYWGLRVLSYKIMNNKKGHYYFLGIQANQLIVDELERKAKFSESIIRYSLVKVKQIDKDVSPILQEEMNDTDNTVDVTAKKN